MLKEEPTLKPSEAHAESLPLIDAETVWPLLEPILQPSSPQCTLPLKRTSGVGQVDGSRTKTYRRLHVAPVLVRIAVSHEHGFSEGLAKKLGKAPAALEDVAINILQRFIRCIQCPRYQHAAHRTVWGLGEAGSGEGGIKRMSRYMSREFDPAVKEALMLVVHAVASRAPRVLGHGVNQVRLAVDSEAALSIGIGIDRDGRVAHGEVRVAAVGEEPGVGVVQDGQGHFIADLVVLPLHVDVLSWCVERERDAHSRRKGQEDERQDGGEESHDGVVKFDKATEAWCKRRASSDADVTEVSFKVQVDKLDLC